MRRSLAPFAVLAALLAFAGSASAASRLYAPLYFSEPQSVAGFDRQADGTLIPLSGSPFSMTTDPPSGVGGIAFAPEGNRAVTSFYFHGGVLGLSVGADGSIAPAQSPIVTPRVHGIAVTPDGRFVYGGNVDILGEEGILAYSLGPDGSLTALGHFGEGKFWDLAVTPDGRFLFATGFGSNKVARFAINADGTLSPLGDTPFANAYYVATSPDSRLLFVGVQGSPAAGVTSFSIAPDGSLSQNGEPALTGNTSMGYFAVAPDGRHIYMPDDNLDGIVTAAVAGDGTLSVIGTTSIENPGSVAASPDGRFLYYAHNGVPGKIGVASIGADGKPAVLPFTTPWESNEPERLVFQPPEATARFSFTPVAPGTAARFDATASTGATRYGWDFGDGTTLANGGPTPSHSYAKAGVYQVRLTVTNEEAGCSTKQIYTGQSTICPGGFSTTKTLDTLPKIGPLVVSNKKFAVAGGRGRKGKRGAEASARPKVKQGTTFHYKLSEPAKVQFFIERKVSGRKVGKKCTPVTPKNHTHKKCSLFRKAGVFTTSARTGKNKTKFSGKLKGRKLRPATYRATATATDSAGGKSAPRRASFQIVGG